jgi:GNAT superfamily N-acetyltransferase
MGTTLLRLAGPGDIDEVRTMFREYEAWLDVDLCFQGFEEELAALPGKYAPPKGRLLLAELDGRLVGVIGLREVEPGICEMKRLYVREAARGRNVGRQLATRIVAEARAVGYCTMRLDTLPDRMGSANALYESLGFRDIPAYYPNPLSQVRYMELDLAP